MNFIGINGSPRKNMNTSKLLKSALDGIELCGLKTKLYNLYDLNYKGCYSCFACKRENSGSYGKCVINDDLKPIFEEIDTADGFLLGSPVYYGDVTGQMRAFLERLMFQYMLYTKPPKTLRKKRLKIGLIYTMNIDETLFNQSSLKTHLGNTESAMNRTLGDVSTFHSYSTNQLENYDNIEYTYFDVKERLKNYQEKFPREIEKAFNFGKALGT
jgi:multimeric flavodoxin WrbA